MHYEAKSWTYLFQGIIEGKKKHDIRDMRDRRFSIGDTLLLKEFDNTSGKYTGRNQLTKVTFITDRNVPCAFSSAVLDKNYAILSLELVGPVYDPIV
jgi:hypothetical protein